jgi:hypothetical protein
MSIRDGWAQASLRLRGDPESISRIPSQLARLGSYNDQRTVVIIPITVDQSEPPLARLLVQVESFIGEHQELLRAVVTSSCTVDLFLGWSPLSPQEGVELSSHLVSLLAQFSASITFDTYTE